MKAPFLFAALCAGPLGAIAQTTIQVAECGDLPSSITTDTTLQFTAPEISCETNTHVSVSSRVDVEITSAEASTKLNNIKFLISERASFLCTVPQLDWTSVETVRSTSIYQAAGGAAMRVEKRATATFSEDVTFSGCALPQEDLGGGSGAAIVSLGTLVFGKTATFKDTVDGGALYSYGPLTASNGGVGVDFACLQRPLRLSARLRTIPLRFSIGWQYLGTIIEQKLVQVKYFVSVEVCFLSRTLSFLSWLPGWVFSDFLAEPFSPPSSFVQTVWFSSFQQAGSTTILRPLFLWRFNMFSK